MKHSLGQLDDLDERAPEGKVRMIGVEGDRKWLIGDFDADTSYNDLADIAQDDRGPGVSILVYDEEGRSVHDLS
jgi:hypothetical protein